MKGRPLKLDPCAQQRAEFKAMLVDKANAMHPRINAGGVPVIEQALSNHSLVFGIWQDAGQPDGVGALILKGESTLKVVSGMEPTFTLDMKCTAIPCVSAEQAFALKDVYGDGKL